MPLVTAQLSHQSAVLIFVMPVLTLAGNRPLLLLTTEDQGQRLYLLTASHVLNGQVWLRLGAVEV